MTFNSWPFLLFFCVFFGFYILTRRRLLWQNILLFVASYIFYGFWDTRFLLLILCCTVTDFITGLALSGHRLSAKNIRAIAAFMFGVTTAVLIVSYGQAAWYCLGVIPYILLVSLFIVWADRLPEQPRRKAYLVGSITYNLSVLCFFKYFNFFAHSAAAFANSIGLTLDQVTLSVILPIGISFFTFQSMSFSIDVYRGQLKPTDSITKFAAYISFFPQLVAGPIEHASHLLPQFNQERHIGWQQFKSAVPLFVWGLYKKIVIADNVGKLADDAFQHAATASTPQMLLGALAFAFQIYGDFSGYSDMARALAKMLGFELILNFNLPYFSRTPSEFWRRWHISLSTWLRDYLYIGLGGNRGGAAQTYRNLMLTMILGGLWHGASWTFVLWGTFHGFILVVYRWLNIDRKLDAVDPRTALGKVKHTTAWAVMSVLTLIGWIIFRSQNWQTLYEALQALLRLNGNFIEADYSTLFYYTAPLVVFEGIQRFALVNCLPARAASFVRFSAGLFVVLSILFISARSGQQFIYFNF